MRRGYSVKEFCSSVEGVFVSELYTCHDYRQRKGRKDNTMFQNSLEVQYVATNSNTRSGIYGPRIKDRTITTNYFQKAWDKQIVCK